MQRHTTWKLAATWISAWQAQPSWAGLQPRGSAGRHPPAPPWWDTHLWSGFCIRWQERAPPAELNSVGFGTLKLRNFSELIKDLQEYCIQFWCPQDMELLEQIQTRSTKLLKWLEHFPYEDRLRKLGAEENKVVWKPHCNQYLKGRMRKPKRHCQELQQQDKHNQVLTERQEI